MLYFYVFLKIKKFLCFQYAKFHNQKNIPVATLAPSSQLSQRQSKVHFDVLLFCGTIENWDILKVGWPKWGQCSYEFAFCNFHSAWTKPDFGIGNLKQDQGRKKCRLWNSVHFLFFPFFPISYKLYASYWRFFK